MHHIVSSKSAEWFTPECYIEAAREVLGDIDLDPASCELANQTVRASQFFDAQANGLTQQWYGRIFMNPPYRRDRIQGRFVTKLINEYRAVRVTEGIVLIGNRTECSWFRPLWQFPLCFTDHRIAFVSPAGLKDSPVNANVFAYLGRNVAKFKDVFSRFGVVVVKL
jgi:ParB family chromosome partitioning protein